MSLTVDEIAFVNAQRVARLATVDSSAQPHLVPVCFAFNGNSFYSAIDLKPKKAISPMKLKRVRNIMGNPKVCLLLDAYTEEWTRLWHIMVQGVAELLEEGEEHRRAIELLRRKYPQYRDMPIEDRPVLKITPARILPWGTQPIAGRRETP